MKQAACALMIFLSMYVGFQQAIIVLHFQHNQQAIEEAFCVNKYKPAMRCHGICYLKKQLQNADQSDTASSIPFNKVDLFTISTVASVEQIPSKEIVCHLIGYHKITYEDPCREVLLLPPIALT